MMRRNKALAAPVLYILAVTSVATAVEPGQLDDYEQGSTMGWQEGGPSPDQPEIVEDGGPNGDGDAFLRNASSGGFGPGGRLAMFNLDDRWLGDYLDTSIAEIVGLDVSLNNLGSEPLTMRFMFEGNGGSVFTQGFELLPGSGWQEASFSLREEDLVAPGNLGQTMSDVTKLWLIHNASASHPGPPVAAILGMDNFMAAALAVEQPIGDYNNNGTVEQADLDLVLLNWGQPGDPPPAAWVNDLPNGLIDQAELDGVLLNWGNSATLSGPASVPEPATIILLALAGAVLAARRTGRLLFRPEQPLTCRGSRPLAS